MTLADVAAAAGVSIATVSWVLNNHSRRISAPTQERVRQAAQRLGYRPNRLARQLRTGTRHTVGVVLPLTIPHAAWLLRGLAREVRSFGYQLEVMDNESDPESELTALRTMVEHQVDAVLLLGDRDPNWPANAELEAIHRSGLPCISGPIKRKGCRVPFVTADQQRMAELATEHLVEQGCRRIAFLTPVPRVTQWPRDLLRTRFSGYLAALERAGLEPVSASLDEVLEAPANDEARLGGFLRAKACDGAVCMSDVPALHAIRVARELGYAVPADFAVVAIGESSLVDLAWPRLTNVIQPYSEYLKAFGQILPDLLHDPTAWDGRGIVTDPQLVVRESSLRRAVPESAAATAGQAAG